MEFLSKNLAYLLAGISVGGQYALIAIGYTMVYGILRLINFAHGDVFMVAGLMMVYLSAALPLYAAVPLVLLLTVALGFVIERAAYKPLRSAPRMSVMISAIGVSYLLQNLALYVTGGLNKNYPAIPLISEQVTIGPATTKVVTLVTPVLTIVLVAVLMQLIHHTKIGMAMRAVAKDFGTSQLMGIKINSVISVTPRAPCPAGWRSWPPYWAASAPFPERWWAPSSSASAKISSRAWTTCWSNWVSFRRDWG